MATLNLNSNYAEQMLSLYLWGQTTAPTPSELADDKWIRPSDATSTAEIDAGAYMATVGRHLSLANQKMFQLFFNNEYRTGGKIFYLKTHPTTMYKIKEFGSMYFYDMDFTYVERSNILYPILNYI